MVFDLRAQLSNMMMGIYYGFSKPAIAAFFHRRWMMERHVPEAVWPTSENTAFDGTGYIPTAEDLVMGFEETIAGINSRRLCPYPFNDPRVDADDPQQDRWIYGPHTPAEEALILEHVNYLKERGLLSVIDHADGNIIF